MADFRFIHAADLHLGSPFQGLALKDADIAALFVEASRKAFSALVDRAIELAVDFVLVAGDVYDGDWKDNSIGLFFNRELARLERAGIAAFLLKGNHDAESIVTRTITLPRNVLEFPVDRPGSHLLEHLRVALHGQGFAERATTRNLVLSYPEPVPGWFNIGLLHTSLTGREPHAPYAPCTLEDLRRRGYDYWALGHVHAFEIVSQDPPVVFPGNLQGRSIREQGEKGAVLVSVEDGRPRLERLIVDAARFGELAVDITGADGLAAVLHRVEQALDPVVEGMRGRVLALRLRLSGKTGLHRSLQAQAVDLRDEVQAACHRRHADIWLEKLELRLEPEHAEGSSAPAELGLDALIPMADFPAGLLAEAEVRIAEIGQRLPGGAGEEWLSAADAATLLREARELLLASASDRKVESGFRKNPMLDGRSTAGQG